MAKKILQLLVIVAILVASFAFTSGASAWGGCASQITVQWGDTLSWIAQQCGTTVAAIQAANPGLGWWVYAGQVLYIPSGSAPISHPTYSSTYPVQWGDTLAKIARRFGVRVADILAVNPQINNASLIYAGQVIYLPAGVSVPTPPPPVYTPPPTNCNCPPPGVDSWATLKIAFGPGMFIRSEPGGPVLLASAMDKTTWFYKLNSVFIDKRSKVWVQVKLFPSVKGFSTGWLLVKDQLGKYYTQPHIDN
jgi:LysM repeat protein